MGREETKTIQSGDREGKQGHIKEINVARFEGVDFMLNSGPDAHRLELLEERWSPLFIQVPGQTS
jgi:hypothetical protein